MKKMLLLIPAALLLLLGGCAEPEPPIENETLYTQVNMWYVKKPTTQKLSSMQMQSVHKAHPLRAEQTVEATNYQRDVLIPVNSRITIVGSDAESIFFEYDGELIALHNTEKYTRISLYKLMQRSFGENPVDLSRFSTEEQAAIRAGRVEPGLSKEAVIVARGYPPAHKTPDLESDDWHYWNGRFNSRIYHFKAGKFVDYTD